MAVMKSFFFRRLLTVPAVSTASSIFQKIFNRTVLRLHEVESIPLNSLSHLLRAFLNFSSDIFAAHHSQYSFSIADKIYSPRVVSSRRAQSTAIFHLVTFLFTQGPYSNKAEWCINQTCTRRIGTLFIIHYERTHGII